MKRYDYRRDYKGWTKEKIENHIPYLKTKLQESIHCQSNSDNYLKRLSYLQSKLEN